MAAKNWAVIAGAGPGLGASLAQKFSCLYNVALLARSPESYDPIIQTIEVSGCHAIGIKADLTKIEDVQQAFEVLKQHMGTNQLALSVYNAGGDLIKKPFADLEADEYEAGWKVNALGAFLFSKQTVPLLLNFSRSDSTYEQHAATILFTSATAGMRGSAQCASYSGGKFAMRSLAQSLGREFGPQGLHVSHIVIDGVIDAENARESLEEHPDAKLNPDAIADVYWHLHSQHRSCFSSELDLRPYVEKW